ncbi:hypothetical protein [[Eubacterium] cellulosolvens]
MTKPKARAEVIKHAPTPVSLSAKLELNAKIILLHPASKDLYGG